MTSKSNFFPHSKVLLCLCTLFLALISQGMAFAHDPTTHVSMTKAASGKRLSQKIIHNLVVNLSKQDVFAQAELPYSVVLSQISLVGDNGSLNSRLLTNDLLNTLLERHEMIIVNQDFSTDITADYRLISYLYPDEARRKGILLGAEYYLMGKVQGEPVVSSRGKVRVEYRSEISVRDIRTNEEVARASYDTRSR